MDVIRLLNKFQDKGIKLSLDNGKLLAAAKPGIIDDDIRGLIKANKQALVEAIQTEPFKVIDYDAANLYGIMPAHYQRLESGTIRAIYRTRQEFTEHVLAAYWTKEEFEQANDLVGACEAFDGKLDEKERGTKIRYIAQAHLLPGMCLHKLKGLAKKYNVRESYNELTDKQVEAFIADIHRCQKQK